MNEQSLLDAVLKNSTFGYTYNKILLDDEGCPFDYIFLDVNDAYASMIGVPRDRIVGKKVSEVLPKLESDSFNWIECFGKVALNGGKTEFEEYSKSVGRWFHLSVLSPERLYFVGISFDITDKMNAELQLARSEELNRRYIENAPDGIFIYDESGKFLKVNKAAHRILGYSDAELTDLCVHDIIVPEQRGKIPENVARLKSDGHIAKTVMIKRKDGVCASLMLDAVSLPDNQYMAFCKDITSYIRERNEKNQYYNVFSSIAQPIVITDPTGKIIAVNDAFTELYGYSREEVLYESPHILNPGKDIYRSLGYGSEQYAEIFSELWKCVADPECGKWEGVVINRRKNGSLAWINLFVNGAYDEKGKLTSIVGLPIDITLKRKLEDKNRIKLYQTVADLAELRDDDTGNHMKRVGIFARMIASEMKMNAKYCADIELFAPMHDIGKVGILDSILRAPRKLAPDEFEVMKTHTVLGHNIVKEKAELKMAADITLSHHERYDGSGYPNGISGSRIPLSAQITALCDVYDALRSRRSYKKPWRHVDTVAYIKQAAGTQFGPEVVACFLKIQHKFETVYQKLRDMPS